MTQSYVGGNAAQATHANWNDWDVATTSWVPATRKTATGKAVPGLAVTLSGGAFFETPGYPAVGRELDWTVWCNNGGNPTMRVQGIPFATWDLWVLDFQMYSWNTWTKVKSGTGSDSGTFGGAYQQAVAAIQILTQDVDSTTTTTTATTSTTTTTAVVAPVITAIRQTAPGVVLQWSATNAGSYRVQGSPALVQVMWSNVPGMGPVPGSNGTLSATDTNAGPQKFYRVLGTF